MKESVKGFWHLVSICTLATASLYSSLYLGNRCFCKYKVCRQKQCYLEKRIPIPSVNHITNGCETELSFIISLLTL